MGIFSRFTDIVNANIVSMLDSAEDPEKMIRLMILEMEDTLVEVKSSAANVIADRKTLERQIDQLAVEEGRWKGKALLALEKKRDELARSALEQKAKLEQEREGLQQQHDQIDKSILQFREDIKKLEDKLNDAKARQKQIIIRQRTAKGQLEIHKSLEKMQSQSAFNKFDSLERNIDRMEGEVEAFQSISKTPSVDEEFEKLERESKVDDELALLKKSLEKSGNSEIKKNSDS